MDIVEHLRNVVVPHAQRFIAGHFGNNAPRPQISIPASEKEDSDLIVIRGIKDAADEIERLRSALGKIADSRKGPSNGDPVTLRNIAREALGISQSYNGYI